MKRINDFSDKSTFKEKGMVDRLYYKDKIREKKDNLVPTYKAPIKHNARPTTPIPMKK
eukprot:CAMPEP_0116905598 /NCGR_PEP_ID=MMETSP0467-20121206/12067_1 /TAXON_ID=283647 /ORGANISM="Mesodinium pulex, Strain SPMC105" /LENGTH=57 /DNA_ID=CAMNT_0004580379 /DNA_START=300 /DNA_END=473 /DNA_ORIENTATION=+